MLRRYRHDPPASLEIKIYPWTREQISAAPRIEIIFETVFQASKITLTPQEARDLAKRLYEAARTATEPLEGHDKIQQIIAMMRVTGPLTTDELSGAVLKIIPSEVGGGKIIAHLVSEDLIRFNHTDFTWSPKAKS